MLLFSFQLGPLTPLLFLLLSSLRFNRLLQTSQIFTVKQLQHVCHLDCIKVQHHFCFISIWSYIIQFQGFQKSQIVPTMWVFSHFHSHSHWKLPPPAFKVACSSSCLVRNAISVRLWNDQRLASTETDCWMLYSEVEVEEIWKMGI